MAGAAARASLSARSASGAPWWTALLALLPPLVAALALAWRGPVGTRFAAVQLAGSVALVTMAAMSFAFDQASSIDLAVTFGVVNVTASLLYAVFVERWI